MHFIKLTWAFIFVIGICDISPEEIERRLEKQKLDKWHPFVENNLILKQGFVNKRKGLFARKRMLLLTMGPRLFYVDPYNMVLKGEIPWSPELRVEPKNFKIFFVHTVSNYQRFLFLFIFKITNLWQSTWYYYKYVRTWQADDRHEF